MVSLCVEKLKIGVKQLKFQCFFLSPTPPFQLCPSTLKMTGNEEVAVERINPLAYAEVFVFVV